MMLLQCWFPVATHSQKVHEQKPRISDLFTTRAQKDRFYAKASKTHLHFGSLALLATSISLSPFTYAVDTGFKYELNPQHNFGKCLDIEEASGANRAKLIQFQCNEQTNQRFRFKRLDGNRYEIRAVHSNKCLDVREASQDNGARVIQFTCNGNRNQQFRLLQDSDQAGFTSAIQAVHSGKCLDVSGASNADKAKVIQFDCHGGLNQRFDGTASAN